VLRQKQCRSFVVLDFVGAGIRAPRPVALAWVNTSSAKMVFELAQSCLRRASAAHAIELNV
jgi:hypothetical protein